MILQNAELKKQEDQIKKNEEAAKELQGKFMKIGEELEQGIGKAKYLITKSDIMPDEEITVKYTMYKISQLT